MLSTNPNQFFHLSLTCRNLVLDRGIARGRDLGLEVHVDELALFGGPVAVGVAVVDELARAGVAHLGCGVREGAVRLPLELVAG